MTPSQFFHDITRNTTRRAGMLLNFIDSVCRDADLDTITDREATISISGTVDVRFCCGSKIIKECVAMYRLKGWKDCTIRFNGKTFDNHDSEVYTYTFVLTANKETLND